MLVAEDYLIIYMNGATPRSKMPGISWLKKCYQMIDRRWGEEGLEKRFYFLHLPPFILIHAVRLTGESKQPEVVIVICLYRLFRLWCRGSRGWGSEVVSWCHAVEWLAGNIYSELSYFSPLFFRHKAFFFILAPCVWLVCVVMTDWGRTWSLWSSLILHGSYERSWRYPGPLSGKTHKSTM